MKWITQKALKSVKDVEAFSRRVAEEGVSMVRSTIGRTPLLSSVVVDEVPAEAELLFEDHLYFLVPCRLEKCGYALFSAVRLPEGHAVANDLPKRRVFHLPGPGAEKTLENLVVAELAGDQDFHEDLPLVDKLEQIGEMIDKESGKVTGGLLLIGGALAVFNPAAGLGLAAKALLPSLTSKLSQHGIKMVSDTLDKGVRSHRQKQAGKQARADLRKAVVVSQVNPLLQALEKAVSTKAAEFDPLFDFDDSPFTEAGDQGMRDYRLTAQAILAVYAGILEDPRSALEAHLGPEDLAWLRALEDLC